MHAIHWFLPLILSTKTREYRDIFRRPRAVRVFSPYVVHAYRNIARVGFPASAIFFVLFWKIDAVNFFFATRGRDPPAATWTAKTQHMTGQQPTQPTAARMKPPARHHEKRTTATAGLALSPTGAPALEPGHNVCLLLGVS